MTSQPKTAPTEVPPQAAMLQMISGFWISRAIYVIAKLGIPDHLKQGPRSAAELAAATGPTPLRCTESCERSQA